MVLGQRNTRNIVKKLSVDARGNELVLFSYALGDLPVMRLCHSDFMVVILLAFLS